MAIGNKGFYATTQAPNVDFGAMVDKGIDKKLARDAAEDAAKAKAKADKEAKKKKLSVEWDKVKQTGRNMYDTSTSSYVKKTISDTQALLRQYDASNDPEERAMLEDKIKMNELNVQTLAGSTDVFKGLIDKVTGNLGNYNEDSADFFTNLMTNVDKGNVRVYSDENGMQMYEVFDTDPNDDIDDSYTISASDLMKEPMLASDYYTKKNTFVDNIQLQKTQRGSRLYNVTEEKRTKETIKQVEVFAKKLTKDKAEMFKFFVDEHGGGTEGINAWNNKTDEEYKEYEDKFYKETYNDALTAIQGSKTLGFGIKPGDGDGGKKTVEEGDGIISNAKQGRVLTGTNAEGGKTTHFLGDKTMVSSVTTDKNKPIDLKLGGKDYSIEEIVFDPDFADGIVLVDATSYSLSDADRQSQGDKTDTSSSSVSSSEGLRVSNKKLKKKLVLPGEPGFELAVTAINGYYGEDYYKNNKAKMYEKTIAQDKAGYEELKEMRESGNYTEAQLKDKSRELLLKVRGMSKKPAKDAFFKNKNEKANKKAEKESIEENYHNNKDLITAIYRGIKSHDSKAAVKNKLSKIVTKNDLKKFLKENLKPDDYKGYFPEEKSSSTTQQTKSKKKRLPGT